MDNRPTKASQDAPQGLPAGATAQETPSLPSGEGEITPASHGGVSIHAIDLPENGEAPRRGNGKGHNQFTSEMDGLPYSAKFHMAAAMLKNGATYAQVHAVTGLSSATIAKVKSGQIQINENVAEAIRKVEIDKLTWLSDKTLDLAFAKDRVKRASFSQLLVGYGIMTEKRELLAGRPTQRTASYDGDYEARQKRIEELQAELHQWEVGKIQNAEVVKP